MKCTFDNVIKLVEEVAPMLHAPVPHTSTYTKHIHTVLQAQAVNSSPGKLADASRAAIRLIGETRALKGHLKEIRRRWPGSQVLISPLDRFTWSAEIGQKQIDADVQEGMRFHDRMLEYAATLEKEFPKAFDLATIMPNQQMRKLYGFDRIVDLLDSYADRLQDICVFRPRVGSGAFSS